MIMDERMRQDAEMLRGEMLVTRIIHDDSSRNRAVARRDRRVGARGREAYLKQYVDRPSGEPACLDAGPMRPLVHILQIMQSSQRGATWSRRSR